MKIKELRDGLFKYLKKHQEIEIIAFTNHYK